MLKSDDSINQNCGSLGASIDNMILSLKNAHSNTLKNKNEELVLFLQDHFIKLTQKGGESSPMLKLI